MFEQSMKSVIIYLYAAVFCLLNTSNAIAGPAKLAVMELSPYGIAKPADGRRGIFVEIFEAIAARAELEHRIGVYSVKRVQKQMERYDRLYRRLYYHDF